MSRNSKDPGAEREARTAANSRTVLVIGAGWVGSATAVRLAQRGHPVTATTRSGRAVVDEPAIEWRAYDSTRDDAGALARLVGDADVVVVCWAPSGRDIDRRRHYVGGAEQVLAACATHPPSRLIYTSSTSALPAIDAEVDESCEQWPDNERGRIQREAEDTIRSGCERLGIPWTILRLAGLYGPGRGLERIYRWEDGKRLAGDGAAPTNMVHLDDVCQAIEAAIDLPPSVSGVVHVCDDDHSTRRRAFAAVARRLGRAAPEWELPEAPPRGKRVSNHKLGEVLGVRLLHPRRFTSD